MNWDQALTALAAGVPALTIGVLAYRRSRKVDAVSEQSGVATGHREGTAQALKGLNDLVDQLQEDNRNIREEARLGVAEAEKRCAQRIEDAVAELRRELTKRPTREELLDANGKLRRQLIDLGETPINGT